MKEVAENTCSTEVFYYRQFILMNIYKVVHGSKNVLNLQKEYIVKICEPHVHIVYIWKFHVHNLIRQTKNI